MMTQVSEKLSFKFKAGYGAAALASTVWIAYYTFNTLFWTTVVGIPPFLAGCIAGIASFWDAITGPVIGTISDNAKFKGGRRRPFLLGIAIPFSIVSWLLFTNWGFSPTVSFFYFTLITMIFFTCYSLFDVPFSSLGAEITQDYDERVKLNSSRLFYIQIACIMGASVSVMIIGYFANLLGSEGAGYSAMGAILGIFCIPGFLVTWRVTKGREIYDTQERDRAERVKFTQMWKVAFSNRPLIYTLGMFSFGVASITLWTVASLYFYVFNMNLGYSMTTSYIMLVSAVVGILYIPVVDGLATRFSKNVSWIVNSVIFAVFITVGFGFVLTPDNPHIIISAYILSALAAGGQMVVYQIGYSMISDCVEVDELMSGQRREGIIYGFVTFIQKSSTALVMFLNGIVLALVHFDGDAVTQSAETLKGLVYLNAYGVSGFILISVLFAVLSPMTRKRHEALCEIIKLKEEGKPYDLEPIKELIGKRMLEKQKI